MLHNNNDILCLLHVSTYFLLTYVAWILHSILNSEYKIVFFVMLCYYSFSCACITHNALHKPTFRNKTLEMIYHQILTLSYGHPTKTMVMCA
jgi:hypothetical protein